MKNILFLIMAVALLSCSSDAPTESGDGAPATACYIFKVTIVTSITPNVAGYPTTTRSETQSCGLTPADAEKIKQQLTTSTNWTSGGYTFSQVQTCVYQKL